MQTDSLVGLVQNGDYRLVRQLFQHSTVVCIQRTGGVKHRQDQIRLRQAFLGNLYTHLFDHVLGLTQSGSVGQPQGHVAQADLFLHHVTCRAGNLGDNAALTAGQQVEQSGLSHVGFAHDDCRHARLENAPVVIGGKGAVQLFQDRLQCGVESLRGDCRDFVLRVVRPGSQVAQTADDAL